MPLSGRCGGRGTPNAAAVAAAAGCGCAVCKALPVSGRRTGIQGPSYGRAPHLVCFRLADCDLQRCSHSCTRPQQVVLHEGLTVKELAALLGAAPAALETYLTEQVG